MSSDNHANHAIIGLTLLLGAAALVGALFYFGGVRGKGDVIFAETYSDKSVSGLSVGSSVNFRGVKVGEVKEISFVGNKYRVPEKDRQRVFILMAFSCRQLGGFRGDALEAGRTLESLVARGLHATVSASGVTGLSHIELDLQPNLGCAQFVPWKSEHVYIPSAVSLLDSFSDSATKVMNQINAMDLNAAWSNLHATVEALAHTADGAQQMMETRKADVERLVGDISEAVSAVKELAAELRENPSLLVRERVAKPLPETRRNR